MLNTNPDPAPKRHTAVWRYALWIVGSVLFTCGLFTLYMHEVIRIEVLYPHYYLGPASAGVLLGAALASLHMLRGAHARLRAEEYKLRLFRQLIDVSGDLLLVFEARGGRLVDINNTASEVLGHSRQALLARDISAFAEAGEDAPALLRRIREEGALRLESTYPRRDGGAFPVELHAKYVGLEGDAYIVALVRDISERKRHEADLQRLNQELRDKQAQQKQLLIQQSKLAALGEMLGTIAHQWRQPLNALSISLQDLQDAYAAGELDEAYLNEAVQRSFRKIQFMSKTIDDFRNFFKPAKQQTAFYPKAAVEEVLDILRHSLHLNHIQTEIVCQDCPDQTPSPVLGYPSEFKQVILNLLSNARDAILDARARGALPAKAQGMIRVELAQDAHTLSIRFHDNGGGIPAEVQDNLFQPYVSTKGEHGTGIGLYISRIIIEENMRGKLSARNHADGAEFSIELPL